MATGFFATLPTDIGQVPEQGLIQVGGEQFRALAVAVIDALRHAQRTDEVTLKTVLDKTYKLYPELRPIEPYLSQSERMHKLVNHSRKALVGSMAKVLRHIIVDELCANPLNYRVVFKGLSPETLRSYLLQPSTKLPAIALAALSQVLAVDLTVSFTEQENQLRSLELEVKSVIPSKVAPLKIELKLQGTHYFPKVKNKHDFASVAHLASPADFTERESQTNLADIKEKISDDDRRVNLHCDQARKTILSTVRAGELTKDNLINLYSEFYPQKNALLDSKARYFSEQRQLARQSVVTEQFSETVELLAEKIAVLIGVDQIDEDQFFERLESKSTENFRRHM